MADNKDTLFKKREYYAGMGNFHAGYYEYDNICSNCKKRNEWLIKDGIRASHVEKNMVCSECKCKIVI